VQCPPQKNKKSRCTNIYWGWAVWLGVFPSPVGVGPGEGAVPPLQKIFETFAWKWHFGCIFCHTQEFFSENKWLKFHDFSMTLSIFHDFPWLAKIPWLSTTFDDCMNHDENYVIMVHTLLQTAYHPLCAGCSIKWRRCNWQPNVAEWSRISLHGCNTWHKQHQHLPHCQSMHCSLGCQILL